MKILLTMLVLAATIFAFKAIAQSADNAFSFQPTESIEQPSSPKVKLEWERRYMSNYKSGDDIAVALAVDSASGAVYVTGHSFNTIDGLDIVTIKYDYSGKEVWKKRFAGAGRGNDYAAGLAIDSEGSVIIAGYYWAAASLDFITIKLNASGEQLWLKAFDNKLYKSLDRLKQLAVDKHNNIYVCGTVGKGENARETIAIKYDSQGNELWIVRSGETNRYEPIVEMTVASSGEVYVATMVKDRERLYKYDEHGGEVWSIDLHDRTLNNLSEFVAADHGLLYLLHRKYDLNHSILFRLVKCDKDGNVRWSTNFTRGDPVDLMVDKQDNPLVLAATNNQYFTVQFDSSGKQTWSAFFSHPDKEIESYPAAIAKDSHDNVYVTGRTGDTQNYNSTLYYTTVKYNHKGEQQWFQQVAACRIVRDWIHYSTPILMNVDSDESLHIFATINEKGCDYATLKYSSEGRLLWFETYNGPGSGIDTVKDMRVDDSGNVYVLGNSHVKEGFSEGVNDFVILKYDADGNGLWGQIYRPPETRSGNFAVALKVDYQGNALIVGHNETSPTYYDILTIKYNSFGVLQWATRYGGSAEEKAIALEVDKVGNIYVLGVPNYPKLLTIVYDSSGNLLWSKSFETACSPKTLAVDDSGNVYVAGSTGRSYLVVKYDGTGAAKWNAQFKPEVLTYDVIPTAIAALPPEAQGGVCVTGLGRDSDHKQFMSTVKLRADGNIAWYDIQQVEYPSAPAKIVKDRDGEVWVTANAITMKYGNAGQIKWRSDFGGNAIVSDSEGNIYVTSPKSVRYNWFDIATAKFNATGELVWEALFNGPEKFKDYPVAIGLDGHENVYVSGVSGFVYQSCDMRWYQKASRTYFSTIKYRQANTSSIAEPSAEHRKSYSLSQNYPNPFNPSTTIRYALAQAGRVSLKIYNLAGQEVATLVEGDKAAGEHEIKWTPENLASGVYLYRLHAGDFVETKKLVLLQ